MFVVHTEKSKPKTIPWPVSVDTPADGGKIKKYEFTGTFNLLDDDEKDAIAAEVKEAAADEDGTDAAVNAWKVVSVDRIMRFMCGWAGVVDMNKTPVEFTRENLLLAARSPDGVAILRGINTAINEIHVGARAKN
ncbi:MAG: hypothetical protein V4463_05195 [Pseudomonadota bacterium]